MDMFLGIVISLLIGIIIGIFAGLFLGARYLLAKPDSLIAEFLAKKKDEKRK